MGRKQLIREGDVITLSTKEATSKLQKRSVRRAIVDQVVEAGGRVTMGAINEHFGYECRAHIASLVKAGWLQVEVAQ